MTDIQAIHIEFIPRETQRYETAGDYWLDGTTLQIRVSKMGNTAYQCMVATHEFVEWLLTDMRGLPEQEITNFDLEFIHESELGIPHEVNEPGFDPRSPYLDEHTLCTSIEMMICAFLGIPWVKYEKTVMSL